MLLSPKMAALALGVAKRTVQRWCETGVLPAIPHHYGSKVTWRISPQALEAYTLHQAALEHVALEEKPSQVYLSDWLGGWVEAMESGGLTGRPFSSRTSSDYLGYATRFTNQCNSLDEATFQRFIWDIPAKQYATREKAYKALLCFGKHLVGVGVIDNTMLEACRKHRPRAHQPPHRPLPSVTEAKALLSQEGGLLDRLLVHLLAHTGLRAGELVGLTFANLNREERLLIFTGKGGKQRVVGLNDACHTLLIEYLETERPHSGEALLLLPDGLPLSRHSLSARVKRLAEKAGFHTSPHALRRYFATKHAMAGRSLATLQRVLGHSSLATTEKYIGVTSLQAAQEMRGWI